MNKEDEFNLVKLLFSYWKSKQLLIPEVPIRSGRQIRQSSSSMQNGSRNKSQQKADRADPSYSRSRRRRRPSSHLISIQMTDCITYYLCCVLYRVGQGQSA